MRKPKINSFKKKQNAINNFGLNIKCIFLRKEVQFVVGSGEESNIW